MNKKTAWILGGAVLFVGLLLGFSLGTYQAEPQADLYGSVDRQRATSVMIDYGDGRVAVITDVELETGQTMLAYMKKVAGAKSLKFETKEYEGLGSLITTIDDKTNGKENKYWQFWVNNVSPDIGASQYIVKPGDVIEWKFLNYKEN